MSEKEDIHEEEGQNHSFCFGVDEKRKVREKRKSVEKDDQSLLVDSGASKHIFNDKKWFDWFEPDCKPEQHTLDLADGRRVTGVVRGKGRARVSIRDENGRMRQVTLVNVLYCPSFPCNIFSVNAATKQSRGSNVTLGAESGELRANNGTSFPIRSKNGLYFLN